MMNLDEFAAALGLDEGQRRLMADQLGTDARDLAAWSNEAARLLSDPSPRWSVGYAQGGEVPDVVDLLSLVEGAGLLLRRADDSYAFVPLLAAVGAHYELLAAGLPGFGDAPENSVPRKSGGEVVWENLQVSNAQLAARFDLLDKELRGVSAEGARRLAEVEKRALPLAKIIEQLQADLLAQQKAVADALAGAVGEAALFRQRLDGYQAVNRELIAAHEAWSSNVINGVNARSEKLRADLAQALENQQSTLRNLDLRLAQVESHNLAEQSSIGQGQRDLEDLLARVITLETRMGPA